MTCSRKAWILLLAIVVGTQGVMATLAASICCCVSESRTAQQSPNAAQCPNCVKVASVQGQHDAGTDPCSMKRVCECSRDTLIDVATTRRVVDQESGIDQLLVDSIQFVHHVDAVNPLPTRRLPFVENLRVKLCVWII